MKRYSMLMDGKINIGKMPTLSKQSKDFKKSLSKCQWFFPKNYEETSINLI